MAAIEIVYYLNEHFDMQVLIDCFNYGEYGFSFVLDNKIETTKEKTANWRSGSKKQKNGATLILHVCADCVRGKFKRNGGSGPDDLDDTHILKFNENFYSCIEQAKEWISSLFNEEVVTEQVVTQVNRTVTTFK